MPPSPGKVDILPCPSRRLCLTGGAPMPGQRDRWPSYMDISGKYRKTLQFGMVDPGSAPLARQLTRKKVVPMDHWSAYKDATTPSGLLAPGRRMPLTIRKDRPRSWPYFSGAAAAGAGADAAAEHQDVWRRERA